MSGGPAERIGEAADEIQVTGDLSPSVAKVIHGLEQLRHAFAWDISRHRGVTPVSEETLKALDDACLSLAALSPPHNIPTEKEVE